MRTTSLLVLTFFLAIQAPAQTGAAAVLDGKSMLVATRPYEPFRIVPSREIKPRIFDRKFLFLAGLASTATILDITTTSRCLSTYANCREGNPLLGSHPSAAKLYGVNLSMLGGQMLASAWLRREMPHRKLWMIAPIAATASHGFAAALNMRTMRQIE